MFLFYFNLFNKNHNNSKANNQTKACNKDKHGKKTHKAKLLKDLKKLNNTQSFCVITTSIGLITTLLNIVVTITTHGTDFFEFDNQVHPLALNNT